MSDSGALQSEELKQIASPNELSEFIEDHEYAVILFVGSQGTSKVKRAIEKLKIVDDLIKRDITFAWIANTAEATAYGLDPARLPALLLFDDGIPERCPHDLEESEDPKSVSKWINDEVKKNDIEVIDTKVLRKIVRTTPALLALFLEKDDIDDGEHESSILNRPEIQELCENFDISIAKVVGREAAAQFGLDSLPAVVYFEEEVPSVFEGSLNSIDDLLEWVERQRTDDTIEEVTEEMLQYLANSKEYLAVFFTGPCDERAKTNQVSLSCVEAMIMFRLTDSLITKECEIVLNELENIDDELDDFGIKLVTTEDIKYAGQALHLRKFPALGMFRNGHFLLYEGPLNNEQTLLSWLIDEETLELPDEIETVGGTMLRKLIQEEEEVAVFFYEEMTKRVHDILEGLESIDEILDKQDIELVKCTDLHSARNDFGLANKEPPFLVIFENEIPVYYPEDGNLLNEKEVLTWIKEMVESEEIPRVDKPILDQAVTNVEDLVVIFYDPSKKKHQIFIDQMEQIDDEAERMNMIMVKSDSPKMAKAYGLLTLPAVVHYENGIPNVYEDDLTIESVFPWLHHHQTESHLNRVTGIMLEKLIAERDFVAALFLDDCDKSNSCEEIVDGLTKVQPDLQSSGILLVQTDDEDFLADHKISPVPGIGFYRNGQCIMFTGNVEHEMSVLKFLTDLDNLVLRGVIEHVNLKLLDFMIEHQKDLFVFFYDPEDVRAKKTLVKLEGINDNLENDNVVLLKCSNLEAKDVYGFGYLPRLIYFEDLIPEPYVGNLNDEGEILRWIADEVSTQEIKLVNRAILEHLSKKIEHVGVLFIDDENRDHIGLVQSLMKLHDELRDMDVTLVQIDDTDFVKELGLQDLPTLVHFSSDIPSIYSGDETNEAIKAWLEKMKNENVIEEVTKEIVQTLKDDVEYIAVFFSGKCEDDRCLVIRELLETMDDELAEIGISFVQTKDMNFPYSVYGIEELPSLGLFKNGQLLVFDGDLKEIGGVRKWLFSRDTLLMHDVIEKINEKLLSYLYETEDSFVVLFYEKTDRDSDEIIDALEKIDDDLEKLNISIFKIDSVGAEKHYGISTLPALVFLQSGIPNIYSGDLLNSSAILHWITLESRTTRIHDVTDVILSRLVEKFEFIAAIFYENDEDPVVDDLTEISAECRDNDVAIVKIKDVEEAKQFGLDDLPQIVFFHDGLPSVMLDTPLNNPDEVLDWLVSQRTSPSIEEVTDEMLYKLIDSHEYVGVFFRGSGCLDKNLNGTDDPKGNSAHTEENALDCEHVLAELETIDDDLDEIGIIIVTTKDLEVAEEHGVVDLPAIGLFRNGHFVQYEGDETNERQILKWMTDEETLKIIGFIDEVNLAMLRNILGEENDAFVFFYKEFDPEAHTILEELESIDEKLDKQDLPLVKISDKGAPETFGIEHLPSLVYFEGGVPELFKGDLFDDNQILKWMLSELKEDEIKELTVSMLEKLVENGKTMAVLFYDVDDQDDMEVLDELERIDDDCSRYGISFVKVNHREKAREYGVTTLPGLLYFEDKVPSVFEGDLREEEDLLDWLVEQKTTDTIERVTDEILAKLIQSEQFLAVFFTGPCEEDDQCTDVLRDLETIDSKTQTIGIMLVTTEDRGLAKQYDLRTFPSLGLFKNGDLLIYEGSLEDEMAVLEWLSDVETLMMTDAIVEVNSEMLEYFIQVQSHVMVFFYRQGNLQDKIALANLEKIDDDLAEKGVILVKCSVPGVEQIFGFDGTPAFVHFNRGIPVKYSADVENAEAVLQWAKKSLNKKTIEAVSSPVLDALIESQNHLLVIFYDNNDEEDLKFLKLMENLDDDCDELSIPLVKISDESKSRQFGLTALPVLMHFNREVPGLYDGNMTDSLAIWSWISQRKSSKSIQLVTDALLEDIIDVDNYVAVLFTGSCKETNEDCKKNLDNVIDTLAHVNDDIEDLGFILVMNRQRELAVREYNITTFPTLALFKNGHLQKFPSTLSLTNEVQILSWFTDVQTVEIPGLIEHVNRKTLKHLIESEDEILVFFYDKTNKHADDMLVELETVDDNLEKEAIEFVRCSEKSALSDYGLIMWPSLIYFEHGIPKHYYGDLRNDDAILGWITKEIRSENLPDVKSNVLDSALERVKFVAVLYYNRHDKVCQDVLRGIEGVREEAFMNDIVFVATTEERLIDEIGLESLPALVYYENNIPFLYNKESLMNTEKLMSWLIYQRNTATIEEVTDAMIPDILKEHDFVAVLFMGVCDADDEERELCATVVNNLEKIDSTLDAFGIVMVMTSDLTTAKELWISKFPTLIYYRNGNPLKFTGKLTNAKSVMRWLTSDKVLNVPGQIISVNELMLSKLVARGKDMLVFFYNPEDVFSRKILRQFERIDDQLEDDGLDFVKVNGGDDDEAAEDFDLQELPGLVLVLRGKSSIFHGDLRQLDDVIQWIESEVKREKNSSSSNSDDKTKVKKRRKG